MLTILVLFAALETATPAPTPVVRVDSIHPRTLADVARERKLGVKKAGGFSAAESTVRPPMHPQDKEDRENKWKRITLEKLGQPLRRNITETFDGAGGAHVNEQWVYPDGVYIYFRDGVATTVQRRD